VLAATDGFAQTKVQLKKADVLKGGRKGEERFEKLIGDVVLVQNTTTIYCDSAYLFKAKNMVEAFGRVRIVEGDSITITGRKLEYDGNTKIAKFRNNVVFTKLATATLYTEYLDYERPLNLAYYFNGGKLVDSINVLTSNKGYYDANTNLASFKRNVEVTNPDYKMTADSLQYNSVSKIIYFVSPTSVVRSDSSSAVYESGYYETTTKKSDLIASHVETVDYYLEAIDNKLDDLNRKYLFRGNVVMTYKKENLIIYGQNADYFRDEGIAKVYNKAYLAKVTENNDTLFMAADTLVSIDHVDPSKKRLLAYNNVRIFKNDMQGVADSIEYRSIDSTIYMYNNPVLWSEGNQMTADSINMLIKNNTINRVFLINNSFVISRDTLINFNQIKGRKMTTFFNEKRINRVEVVGNGESLYFALDEKSNSAIGMNRILCSNITIRFNDGKIKNISFYNRPEANFIPPHELRDEDKQLKGFSWKEDAKPTRDDVVQKPLSIDSNK
jgi:lipopolysaccharide export system protein LptA